MILLSSAAIADIVYLRNGKIYAGKVTRSGAKVLIDIGSGVIVVKASNVLRICDDDGNVISHGQTQPAKLAKSTKSAESAAPALYSTEHLTRPEAMLFRLMRRMPATAAGMDSYKLRKQLEQWRTFTQDRRRKVGSKWVRPEYFAVRRMNYAKLLDECLDLAKKIKKLKTETNAQRAKHSATQKQLFSQLRKCAKAWPEPQMRLFLRGVAEYRAGKFMVAEKFLSKCAADATRVAAFHQAHGMALSELNRHTRALEAFVHVLNLKPQSRPVVTMVRDALEKVSGRDINKPIYKRAAQLLSGYSYDRGRKKSTSTRTEWFMPGKRPWTDRDNTLPMPVYDRMTFRQAIAIPIGENILLVDRKLAKDATELMVKIDAETTVPAKVIRLNCKGSDKEDLPLSLISVNGYQFTPVLMSEKLSAGTEVTVHSLGIFEQMGLDIFRSRGRVGPTGIIGAGVPGNGAGPVFTADGAKPAGFMTGLTDALAEQDSRGRFITASQLKPLLAWANRRKIRTTAGLKRKTAPKPAPGKTFIVYSITGEIF